MKTLFRIVVSCFTLLAMGVSHAKADPNQVFNWMQRVIKTPETLNTQTMNQYFSKEVQYCYNGKMITKNREALFKRFKTLLNQNHYEKLVVNKVIDSKVNYILIRTNKRTLRRTTSNIDVQLTYQGNKITQWNAVSS